MSARCPFRRQIRLARPRERGQAVVEFALVMVFFLMFMLAVIDLGRAFFTVVGLENAAAEGALYGMANPTCEKSSDGTNCADPNNIEYRIKHESENVLLDPTLIQFDVKPDNYAARVPGSMIGVTVTYPFRPIIPLLSTFGADPLWLRRNAFQLIP